MEENKSEPRDQETKDTNKKEHEQESSSRSEDEVGNKKEWSGERNIEVLERRSSKWTCALRDCVCADKLKCHHERHLSFFPIPISTGNVIADYIFY